MPRKPLIEIDTDRAMIKIAKCVEVHTDKKYGFMVLVFPFESTNGERAAHYISNCRREDMIKALREKADALEQGRDIRTSGSMQ